jgi:hypothetical protein
MKTALKLKPRPAKVNRLGAMLSGMKLTKVFQKGYIKLSP